MQDARFSGLIDLQERVRAAGSNLQAIMDAIVSEYSVMPQANGIVVELRDTDQVYYAAASGTSEALVGLRLPINASLSGMSILTGQPLYCEDSETDSRVNRAGCRRVNLRSMIVVPIPHGGQTVGVLKYYSSVASAFTEEDMMLAHLLVGPLAVGFSTVGEADAARISDELRDLIQIKQNFVATVTHELRTPLTAISGALALIVNGAAGALPPRAQTILGIASRNAERMKRLVDDLLTFEKTGANAMSFHMKSVDLNRLLSIAVEEAQPNAQRKSVALDLRSPVELLTTWADEERLLQSVNNLISNAVKFSPVGAVVIVRLARGGDEALVTVQDHGPGVSEAFRKRLFEPFAQDLAAESNDPSSGLGLAITRSLIEHMGGLVRLAEDNGAGATFEIVMPLERVQMIEGSTGGQPMSTAA